jgi:hypothetical protein
MIWKDIKGYEGLYAVNINGDIKSYAKTDRKGALREERILKPQKDSNGYTRVYLIRNGQGKRFKRHRIVAQAFIPNPLNKKEVNHKNGIKSDNVLSNLEWATPLENTRHAWETGLIKRECGERCNASKLKEEDVLNIRKNVCNGANRNLISKEYGIALTTISAIILRKTWKHI